MIEWMCGDVLATMDIVIKVLAVPVDDFGDHDPDGTYECLVGWFVGGRVVYLPRISVLMSSDQMISFLGGDYPAGLVELIAPEQLALFDGGDE